MGVWSWKKLVLLLYVSFLSDFLLGVVTGSSGGLEKG